MAPKPRSESASLGLVAAVEGLVAAIEGRIAEQGAELEGLHREVRRLETENASLRRRLSARPKSRPTRARPAKGRTRSGGLLSGTRRSAPDHINAEHVLAAIVQLGQPTAAEIADAINEAEGANVISGRSVRWIAERAGAKAIRNGSTRRYALPSTSRR